MELEVGDVEVECKIVVCVHYERRPCWTCARDSRGMRTMLDLCSWQQCEVENAAKTKTQINGVTMDV